MIRRIPHLILYITCPLIVSINGQEVKSQQFTEPAPFAEGRFWNDPPPKSCSTKQSYSYKGIYFTGRYSTYASADTWYPSWGADDRLYSPFTDGAVQGKRVWSMNLRAGPASVGHAVIEGNDPLNLSVVEPNRIYGKPAPYGGRYPCGSLHYNGVWYIGTYGLNNRSYKGFRVNWPVLGPCTGFHISKDNGKTWIPSPRSNEPGNTLFPEPKRVNDPVKLGAPHFVDFGKNMEHSPDGMAYLVGHGSTEPDRQDRPANLSWITGDQIYICRVKPSPETINDSSKYEYFAGNGADGKPRWSSDFSKIEPIYEWDNNCGCVTITYNAALKRYFMCVTDGVDTVSEFNTYILESKTLIGPWEMVTYMKNFGVQAYFVNIPSKFISKDGKTFWLCYSANFDRQYRGIPKFESPAGSDYALVLQEVRVIDSNESVPVAKEPSNFLNSPDNLALIANVKSSSNYEGYRAKGATDGQVGGYPDNITEEWASNGERNGAWLKLTWDNTQEIGRIILFDRPTIQDRVIGGRLEFSDGSSIPLKAALKDDATRGLVIEFAPKKVTWVKFTVDKVHSATRNIGLSEMGVFRHKATR